MPAKFNFHSGQSVLCAPPGMMVQEGAGPPAGLGLLRSTGADGRALTAGLGLGLGGWGGGTDTGRSLGCALGAGSALLAFGGFGDEPAPSAGVPAGGGGGWTAGCAGWGTLAGGCSGGGCVTAGA